MALPNVKHRFMVGRNIHVPHRWRESFLNDIDDSSLTQDDVGKFARIEPPAEGEGGIPPRIELYFLQYLDDSGEGTPVPFWLRLLTEADAVDDTGWVKWEVPNYEDLNALDLASGDVGGVAHVSGESSYYVLALIDEESGKVWKRLDNVDSLKLPIAWVIEPEGYPASLSEIAPYPEEVHQIAYDPSGTSHYWVLSNVEDNGEGGYNATWTALDNPPTDISEKADKRLPKVSFTGTARTITSGDFDSFVESTNASLQTYTLSALSDDPVRSLVVLQNGAGKVRFVAGSGATVRPPGTIETSQQYATATLALIGPNTWLVSGDVTVS